jgi:alkanesulfonate monooxygenase SsuD/methylene tetrahydromethanopterin reductase-like flavin-dependent oxidoreductase (luciferase family)
MKIGVQFQTHGVEPSRFVSVARSAAEMGVDGVFLWDHMVPFVGSADDSAWETWTLLGSMATVAAEFRVDLGVLVSPLTFRHPAVLARAAATVARMSGGGFVLGVGAGGFVHDDRLFDDRRSTSGRMADFRKGLESLRHAVDDQNHRHGTTVRIWVGGDGVRVTVPTAARWADGWSGFAPMERWRDRRVLLEGLTDGRPMETSVLLTPLDEVTDVRAWRSAGTDWIIRSLRPNGVGDFDLDPIRRLVADAR